ncbi:ELM1/GtrOC1 family putative glycosyltransferase [Candidatus Omnitrophota bacterium]
MKKILRSHYKNLGMSVMELLKLPVMGKKYLNDNMRIENFERVKEALAKGKGIILLTAHFGNWEMGSLSIGLRKQKVYVFAREQKHKRLNALLNNYRRMTGCHVITKGFSARAVIKALKDNSIVAMLADQDAGPSGVFVDFFNRPASTARGPVSFALRTGATILPTFAWRSDRKDYILRMEKPLELIDTGDKEETLKINLENISSSLENYIRKFPDKWLWSHKRWKSSPQRTIMVLNDGKPGHLNQALAVAEMVKEALGSRLEARGIKEKPIVKIKTVDVRFKNRFTRMFLDAASFFAGKRCQGCLRCVKLCLKKESFNKIKEYADIVISCGASSVAANAFLKYENNAKGIVIMNPGLGRSNKFDLIVLPRHDAFGKSKSNALITEIAPNRVLPSASSLSAKGETSPATAGGQPPAKGLGLLIGGDAKNFKLKKEDVEKVIDSALKMDCEVFVSTSRRTSPEIEELVEKKLSGEGKWLVIASKNNKEGVVQEIFDKSEVIIVSSESMSMISEAVSSGKHVVVFKATSHKPQARKSKYEKSVSNLEQQGYIRISAPDMIYDTVKKLLLEKPEIKKIDDRKRIVKRLESLM